MVGSDGGSVTSISVLTSQANAAQMYLSPAALSDRIRLELEQGTTSATETLRLRSKRVVTGWLERRPSVTAYYALHRRSLQHTHNSIAAEAHACCQEGQRAANCGLCCVAGILHLDIISGGMWEHAEGTEGEGGHGGAQR